MRHSEAVKWLDAMHYVVVETQAVLIETHMGGKEDGQMTELDGRILRSISPEWLFNGAPQNDQVGLGKGILSAIEKIQDRVCDGGKIDAMELFNLNVIFNRDQLLSSVFGIYHSLNRKDLTVNGNPVNKIPEFDIPWLSAIKNNGWTPEEGA